MLSICEDVFTYESALAFWWRSASITGHNLRTVDGRSICVLYTGRPGGNAGPDFRDAIILIDGCRTTGDVELHLQASSWKQHGHHNDPRYNHVILHVIAGGPVPINGTTMLLTGQTIPILIIDPTTLHLEPQQSIWPCHRSSKQSQYLISSTQERNDSTQDLLAYYGMARFTARLKRYQQEFINNPDDPDRVFVKAIAEAIGYGHDPILTRSLINNYYDGAILQDERLDQISLSRINRLIHLLHSWLPMTPLAICCGHLLAGGKNQGWNRLLSLFIPSDYPLKTRGWLGTDRATIIIWNAILPSLAAYGRYNNNRALEQVAQQVAFLAPGLPSNTITRYMVTWLGLSQHPAGALRQQGLHHIYAQWCHEKNCQDCPL
jgi:hypothetical protein